MEDLKEIFENKIILVTGGCGSIGSEIVKQILQYNPHSIRIFDNSEDGHFKLNQKIKSEKIRNLIGDVRDRERILRAMEDVDIVFHAAALKHVPFCEYNPFEAVNTNVVGTQNVVDAAVKRNIEIFVGISTDKAVNPINTMGATKLLSEKIITNAPIGQSKTKFCCVRFGNVLNSNGSVIPIFNEQISKGGPVTITSEKMTRFFMSIEDSVNLVLKAASIVKGGETFILKMDALKITDLAEVMVEELAPKYGYDPKSMKYKNIGVRIGEKLYERLMNTEESMFAEETEDMIILKDSLLARSNYKINIPNGNIQTKEYHSDNVKHLNKETIRKLLYEKKIL